MGKETPCWWPCSYVSWGRADVHLSLMPGLVSKALLCLRLKKNKSNQTQAAQGRRRKTDRDLWTTMPPTDLPLSAQHRQDIDTHCCRATKH